MASKELKDLSVSLAGDTTPTPVTTAPVATQAITPEALAPTAVIDVKQPKVATGQEAMMADIGVQSEDAFTKAQTEATQATQKPKETALTDYLSQLKKTKGVAGLTAEAYGAQGGVDTITPELNDINDKIRREQLSLRRATEAIQLKGGGLASGASAEIGNLERESFAKQADLSVIQMATQGRYDSAKEAADRAVAAKLEQQTNYTNSLKFLYQENKDIFDKAEQREFDTLLANRERALQQEKENATSIYDIGIQASLDGAPTAVVERMLASKTRNEALALGGQYIGALDRQAKEANIAQSYASVRASNLSSQKSEAEIKALNQTVTGQGNIAINALDSFSGTLAQNNREQFTKSLTGSIRRGDVENTETALKNAAQAAAGKAMTEDVVKRDQAIGSLRDVQKALAEYKERGGDTSLLVGGYESLQARLGKTSDPALAKIETRINLALNSYTNAVSGASFTPQESERYKALFPSTSNQNELNTAKIDTLIETFESNNQSFYGNYYGGYTPSQLAEQAVYEELIATATPEQLQELGITQ